MTSSTRNRITFGACAVVFLCGLRMIHAEASGATNCASALLAKFETVVYVQSTLLTETRNTSIDTVDGLAQLRTPFSELTDGLKIIGRDLDLHLEQNSTVFLLGAEEFSPPNGIGPVTSRRSYVIVLKPNVLTTLAKEFSTAAIVTINGVQVWSWKTPPVDGASPPTTFYAAPIGSGYLLIANDQKEFVLTADALSKEVGGNARGVAFETANLGNSYGFWAHRSIRRGGPAPDVGFNDLGGDVGGFTFYASLGDRKGYVEADVPSGDVKSISTLLPAPQSRLFKSVGGRTWRATIPLSRDESSSETVIYVLFHLGLGANL